jgi:hypothetical protein
MLIWNRLFPQNLGPSRIGWRLLISLMLLVLRHFQLNWQLHCLLGGYLITPICRTTSTKTQLVPTLAQFHRRY